MKIKPFLCYNHYPLETAASGIISIHEESHMNKQCEITEVMLYFTNLYEFV